MEASTKNYTDVIIFRTESCVGATTLLIAEANLIFASLSLANKLLRDGGNNGHI